MTDGALVHADVHDEMNSLSVEFERMSDLTDPMNAPENVLPVHDPFISDPALYGRDPGGYCWSCSPEIAYIHRLEDRSNWLGLLGDCTDMCHRCPYSGKMRDRSLGIGNMPLMAMRQRYLNQTVAVADLIEAAGYERPEFQPWPRDYQLEFWRTDDLPVQPKKRIIGLSKVDWIALKARFDLRTEWESFYGPAQRRSGKAWMTYCPFHEGYSKTLALYEDGYHCFNCSEHGDVINVLRASKRLSAAIRGAV